MDPQGAHSDRGPDHEISSEGKERLYQTLPVLRTGTSHRFSF
jgi:hypothetical protein